MAAAKSRICFIIIISGLSFKWGAFSLKPGQPRVFSELIDQLQHLRQIACKLESHLDKPEAEACSNFFYFYTHLALIEPLETKEVSEKIKKFASAKFPAAAANPLAFTASQRALTAFMQIRISSTDG